MMLKKFRPNSVACMLKSVYPNALNGKTFLHVIGEEAPHCFAELFGHCGEICNMTDRDGSTPMISTLLSQYNLRLIYEIVSENIEYIIGLNAK